MGLTGRIPIIRNDYARYWQRRVVAEEILAQPEAQRPKQLPGTTIRGRGGLQRWVAKSPLAAKIVEFLFGFTEVEHMGEFDWYFWKKIYGAARRGHISEERMKLFDKVGVERKVFLLEERNKALEYFLRQFEPTGAIGQEIEELTKQLHVRTNSLLRVNTEKLAEGIRAIAAHEKHAGSSVFKDKRSYSFHCHLSGIPSEDQAHLDGYWYRVFCLMAGLFRHLQMNHTEENRQALSAFIETIPYGRRLQLKMFVARHRWVQLLLVREMPTFSDWFFGKSTNEFFVWAEGYWSHARHELLEQAKALNITKIIPMEPPVVKIDEDAERAFRTALAA